MNIKIQLNKIFLLSILVIAFATFFIPTPASAATNAGVMPGSFWYGFDIAFEKINLFFTFNPEKKAVKALEYADERLAEVEAVANENKPEAVATAMANYQENISLATAESKDIKDKEKAQNLLSEIANNTSKHQGVLAEVYNKVPDEAKQAIEKAIEISIKGHEEALKEIQVLKKTVEELQKDIELLKKQGQSDQSKEIEILRKEVETLKSQQSSKSTKPQVVEKVVEKIVEVPPTTQKSTAKLSNSEIIGKVKPSVVYIQTSDGSGSGMVIENNGYVLTNAHVVSGFSSARIKLTDGRLFIGSVVGRDENIDLALLKIQGDNLPTVVLGDSSTGALKQGDEVFTFGYPFGLEGDVSFKEGTVSRRFSDGDITYLEISAEIHPGNSGGPLVNKYGEVIGINTWAHGGGSIKGILVGETIKFALPINLIRGLIPELKSGRNVVLPKIAEPISLPIPLPSPIPAPSPSPAPTPQPTPIPAPTTPSPVDTIPPIISSVQSTNIDVHSTTITWVTNEYSNSIVYFGLSSGSYFSSTSGSVSATNNDYLHTVNLSSLTENTKYYYQITSTDNSNLKSTSNEYNFTTAITPCTLVNQRITVDNDSSSPVAHQVVMGKTSQTLGIWRINGADLSDTEITDINVRDIIDTTNNQASFLNLRWYKGNTQVGPVVSVSTLSTSGYTYAFHFSSPIIIPQNNSVSLELRGDVASFASGGVTSNSIHIFRIEKTTDITASSCSLPVIIYGPNNGNATDVNPITVVKTKLTITSDMTGITTNGHPVSSTDVIAVFVFTADPAYDVTISALTLKLAGSSLAAGMVRLIDSDTGLDWGSTSVITWNPSISSISFFPNYTLSAGATKRLKIQMNTLNFVPTSGSVNGTLAQWSVDNDTSSNGTIGAPINATCWGDGTTICSGSTGGFNLEAKVLPIYGPSVRY